MEFEQIIKRLDWLDEEHRKGKSTIAALEERLAALEGSLNVSIQQFKRLSDEMSRLSTAAARMEQLDNILTRHQKETKHLIKGAEKRREEFQGEVDKRYRLEFDGINKTIAQFRKVLNLTEIRRELKARAEEDLRLGQAITDLEEKMEETLRAREAFRQASQSIDAGRQQDTKRLTDLQGEVTAMRKRMDEVREKSDLHSDNVRHIEIRLTELLASETERRQAHNSLMEQHARLQVERDQAWQEWKQRFDKFGKDADAIESQLQGWFEAQRALKRAQETYNEIIQKFERRINEITEMQRLAEDRLRQEWVTFKADDQKRWSSYALTQEEQHRDIRSDLGKLRDRVTALDDLSQTHQDILQQFKEANEEYFQGLLAQIHEMLSAYERAMGTTK